jgi:hypothetical protein
MPIYLTMPLVLMLMATCCKALAHEPARRRPLLPALKSPKASGITSQGLAALRRPWHPPQNKLSWPRSI